MTTPSLESSIEAVTVFRSGALITRVARLEGDRVPDQVRLVGLPLSLDDSSLRVRVEPGDDAGEPPVATGLRVGLEVADEDAPLRPPDEEELRQARRAEAEFQDRIAQVEREMDRLKRLELPARPPLSWSKDGEPRRAVPGSARLELLAFQQRELERSLAELLELRVENQRASERVAELEERAQRASSAGSARAHELRKTATVSFRAGQGPVEARLRLEYRVPGARWLPAYALDLDRTRGDDIEATLACRAMVCQRTGEDWNDVNLTLTTADAQDWCDLPELTSMRIGRWQPPPRQRGFKPPPVGVEELYADYDRARETPPAGPAGHEEVEHDEPTGQYSEETLQAALVEAEESWDEDRTVTRELRRKPPAPSAPMSTLVGGGAPDLDEDSPFAAGQVPPERFQAQARELEERDLVSPLAKKELSRAAVGAPMDAPVRKSAGILSMFGGGPPRGGLAEAWGTGPSAVPPPEAPAEPVLRPDEEMMAYGKLHLPPLDHPRRGVLTIREQREVYLELLARQEVTVSFDVMTAVNAARTEAQAVAAVPIPRGHSFPSSDRGFAHAYPSEAPVSLASDGRYHSLPVALRSGDASLRHVTVPRESQEVYRFLEMQNPFDAPLLVGPVDVYVGGDYLLTTSLHRTAPMGELRLGLGVEPSIKVSRNTSFSEETTGLIKGMRSLEHQIRIELINHLDAPAAIEVRERLPQPRKEDDEIAVEVAEVSPAWEPWEQDEHPLRGGYRWQVVVDPGERQELSVDYRVRIAAKYELVGGNRREA